MGARIIAIVFIAFSMLSLAEETKEGTFEKNPRYQHVRELVNNAKSNVESQLGVIGCQSIKAVLGKAPTEIIDHYQLLMKDYASLISSNSESDLDTANEAEAYSSITKWFGPNELKEILDKIHTLNNNFESDPTLLTKLDWKAWLSSFNGNVKKAFLALSLNSQYVKQAFESHLIETDPRMKDMSSKLNNDPHFKEFLALRLKAMALFIQANKGEFHDGDILKNAQSVLTASDFISFKKLQAEYGLTVKSIETLSGEISQSPLLKQINNTFQAETMNRVYGKLGFSNTSNPYKEIAGLILATSMYEKGYSPTDIEFVISRSSVAYKAIDFLYDHLGKNDKNGVAPLTRDNSSFDISTVGYDSLLKSLRTGLTKDESLRKDIVASILGLSKAAKYMPPEATDYIDWNDDEQLTAGLIALYSFDRDKFDQKILPFFLDSKMNERDRKNILFLLENAKLGVDLPTKGAKFAVEKLVGMPRKETKWDGIYTPHSLELIQTVCENKPITSSVKAGLNILWNRLFK